MEKKMIMIIITAESIFAVAYIKYFFNNNPWTLYYPIYIYMRMHVSLFWISLFCK